MLRYLRLLMEAVHMCMRLQGTCSTLADFMGTGLQYTMYYRGLDLT
jgi:hypothetical protein